MKFVDKIVCTKLKIRQYNALSLVCKAWIISIKYIDLIVVTGNKIRRDARMKFDSNVGSSGNLRRPPADYITAALTIEIFISFIFYSSPDLKMGTSARTKVDWPLSTCIACSCGETHRSDGGSKMWRACTTPAWILA